VRGTLRYGDQVFEEVGVRLKGNRSMRPLEDKPAFKIKLDKYRKDQRFLGLSRLTLNNMVEDPSQLREILGYRLYRDLGVPAPAAFYAELELDGAPYGLYAVIETVDEDFLSRRFEDGTGSLYEGEYGCDLYPADVEGFDRDSGEKDPLRGDLRALAEAASAGPERLLDPERGLLDMERFLAYLAVSAFIGDFDGYRHAHNYRIYHHPDRDKWSFIPWGIDRAFKKRLSIYESWGLAARRCFDDARCRADYVRVQRAVLESFARLDLVEGAEALAAFIEPAVKRDPKRPAAERINRARKQLLDFLRERPAEIAAELTCIGAGGEEIDGDGDGFGCLDCNDGDAAIHPGAAETCDGVDNDCSGQVDDNPACPVCETLDVGGRRFALCERPRSQGDAAAYCRGMGGTLAVIESPEQAEAVANAAAALSKERWWIGLEDRDEEGTFLWPGGARVSYSDWKKGEPDNGTCNQDCVVIDPRKKGRWHDTHCGQPLPFACVLDGTEAGGR
jgi:hypothetical protein